MKSAVTAVVFFILLSGMSFGMEVRPDNFSIPMPDGVFSFDIVVTQPPILDAYSVQVTIDSVSGPSILAFDKISSEAVEGDVGYWIYGNSAGAGAIESSGSYSFGDGPDDPAIAGIDAGDILARFAFTWDGTVGDYEFTLDLSTANSFALLSDFSNAPIALPDGDWFSSPVVDATDLSFTVHIPEPASMFLLGLGGLAILRKLRR